MARFAKFGNQIPFCEPAWYQGGYTPYYNKDHVAFRAKCRGFSDELAPHVDKWIKTGYPKELHEESYKRGIQGIIYPREFGGTRPDNFDPFFELIMIQEAARVGAGVLGQNGIDSMALPPILIAGSEYIKNKVCRPVITGEKHISLAISEPGAGSDVANIQTEAVKSGDGAHYIVNGSKKWITGGMMADFFTVAVRTGGEGMGGISLLLLEKDMPGIKIRKMETQFDNTHSTTFITLTDVKVPCKNLIGAEGAGFMLIVTNFNHERFVISAMATAQARLCYKEAVEWALTRKTFGKRLIGHQVIRFKLAEMARQIEALQDSVEKVAFQFKCGVPDMALGGTCALLKVNSSKVFEFCAREASQILGGSSIVREGKGKRVERLYRDVRAAAIPGGSEEILLDFAMRQVAAKADRIQAKSNL